MNNINITDFFLKEYESIVKAHFNSAERVTSFFRYILIIYSAAIILLVNANEKFNNIFPYIFIAISIVGFFILMYLIQLRNESILYARTLNGIRRYFYDMYFKEGHLISTRYNILPLQTQKPPFWDTEQFIWIFLSLVIINSLFFAYGLFLLGNIYYNYFHWFIVKLLNFDETLLPILQFVILSIIIISFAYLQYRSYLKITKKQESSLFFYEHILGVDIDGVLNEHEEHFCNIFNKLYENRNIEKHQITKIPVHLVINDITENEERKVFNTKEYWESMPSRKDINKLNHIREQLGYKINIFTWRDWGKIIKDGKKEIIFDVEEITKRWLKKNNINYDKLYFEKGNLHNPVTSNETLYKNRFYICKKYKVKYFVEDDLDKAIILANICKVVFLIDHLYNQNDNNQFNILPHNVIRVKGWEEIFEYLKKLG